MDCHVINSYCSQNFWANPTMHYSRRYHCPTIDLRKKASCRPDWVLVSQGLITESDFLPVDAIYTEQAVVGLMPSWYYNYL